MAHQLHQSDRFRGALLGLAVGDALGTTVKFRPRGTFAPVTEMTGGGPFNLEPGQWTDDTSMALCLATSLAETGRFDLADQIDRYCRWHEAGYLSSNGRCFDVGNTVSAALRRYRATGILSADPSGQPDRYVNPKRSQPRHAGGSQSNASGHSPGRGNRRLTATGRWSLRTAQPSPSITSTLSRQSTQLVGTKQKSMCHGCDALNW